MYSYLRFTIFDSILNYLSKNRIMGTFLKFAAGGAVAFISIKLYKNYTESRKKLPDGSHVVIVGAGYAGLSLADKLKGKGNYTIIDAKDCLHHNMAALRAAVEPGFAIKTFIPFKPKLGDNFRQGRVVGIDTENKTVKLLGQEEPLEYSHLVIATGSSGPFPGKCDYTSTTSELLKQYDNFVQSVLKAQKIVIIGGGAVGVELAAEIAGDYPNKSVTIVHNGETLVTKVLKPDALDRIKKRLDEMKINVIMGDTVENTNDLDLNKFNEGMIVKTTNGLEMQADMVVSCVGLKVNSEAYENSIPEKVNSKGQLMVDDYMQVKGLDKVYAIGDCNDLPVGKLAMESAFQAAHLWENLASKSDPKPYKPGSFKMVVPLGRDGGVTQFGNTVLGDWAAKRIKSKDVFVTMAWKMMGQPVPQNTSTKSDT